MLSIKAVREVRYNIDIRALDACRYEDALELTDRVFSEFEAPEYSQEGIDEFHRSIRDEDYLSQLRMFGAFLDDALVGVIATRNKGAHIALFFVDGKHHRQGIGRALFETVLSESAAPRITVSSSPYAVPVYRALGFAETALEQTTNGVRYTPMELVR